MRIEDLYRAARNAGMLTPVIADGETVHCVFRNPDDDLLDGLTFSPDPQIDYPVSQLSLSPGDTVVIRDTGYRVRHVRTIRDGSECRATLSVIQETSQP